MIVPDIVVLPVTAKVPLDDKLDAETEANVLAPLTFNVPVIPWFPELTTPSVEVPVTLNVVPIVAPAASARLFAEISAPLKSKPPAGVNVPVTVTLFAKVVFPVILGTVNVVAVKPATVVAPVTPKVPPIVVFPEICGAPVITPVVSTKSAPTVVFPVLAKDAALTLVALRSNVPATVKFPPISTLPVVLNDAAAIAVPDRSIPPAVNVPDTDKSPVIAVLLVIATVAFDDVILPLNVAEPVTSRLSKVANPEVLNVLNVVAPVTPNVELAVILTAFNVPVTLPVTAKLPPTVTSAALDSEFTVISEVDKSKPPAGVKVPLTVILPVTVAVPPTVKLVPTDVVPVLDNVAPCTEVVAATEFGAISRPSTLADRKSVV